LLQSATPLKRSLTVAVNHVKRTELIISRENYVLFPGSTGWRKAMITWRGERFKMRRKVSFPF